MKNTLSKKRFCKIIEELKEARKLEKNIADAVRVYDRKTGNWLFDEHGLMITNDDIVQELLELIMHDEYHDITYFCAELDYGDKYQPGDVVDGDKEIDFSTPEKLYDYLIEKYHPFNSPMEDDLK